MSIKFAAKWARTGFSPRRPDLRATGEEAVVFGGHAVSESPGGDEDQRFLAEGLTEELIVELGRFKRLHIASRSASFAVDSSSDPVSVGEALRVRYVLDGQVRKIGKNFRLGLTLSETEAGSVVLERQESPVPSEDLWDMLDVTVSKTPRLSPGGWRTRVWWRQGGRPPDNIEAFECVLRGMDHHRLGGVTYDNAREAVKWFSKAIEADPNYAAACMLGGFARLPGYRNSISR